MYGWYSSEDDKNKALLVDNGTSGTPKHNKSFLIICVKKNSRGKKLSPKEIIYT